ncbi:helix-turn-helix transcriptional regulator [Paraburkholderia acidipaludis]|uniref:helix-turn-helix transcriptional regulator n=1 Tax=Paraburkholderia acidipaludis TaxID=660537 RepID=UPI000482DB3B|nr:helix-turn-helix transcriptional regulator [Paraburkholderia acidipaludis]
MHEPDGFLLSLHAAAREVPFEVFQEHALNLLRQILPFDAARWGMARHDARGAEFHAPYLYNDSSETLKDYDEVREDDHAAHWCLANLDTALNFHLPDLYVQNRTPGLLDYVHRYRHIQALIIGRRCGEAGMRQAISLYRAYEDKPFAEAQRRMLEVVFPHLAEALQTSMAFHVERIRPRGGEIVWSLAICDTAGEFRFVEPGFCDLLREEWPNLAQRSLPRQLAGLIGGARKARFQGRAALFVIEVVHGTVFVRARVRVPVDALSPRELEVARLAVAGLTHKEIAKVLALAPATVRNHLQAIHERAGVHTNAELVQQLRYAGV